MSVDWFTWQIAWHDALFTVHDIAGDALARQPAAIDREAVAFSFERCGLKPNNYPVPQYAAPLDNEASKPAVPDGFTVKRVEGHGWVIDPPSGSRWIAFEGTPAGELMQALAASPAAPLVEQDERGANNSLQFESALSELINKIDSGLDSGDLLQDARRASAAIDVILRHGDLVANAHDYFRDSGERYEKSIQFRIGWNACLDAIANARAASTSANVAQGAEAVAWLHTMHMELDQTDEQLSFSAENPWGTPGLNYSEEYTVTSEPLFAAPPAQTALAEDARDAIRREAFDEACAAIKAEDDRQSSNDYMLDSDDCIAVIRALTAAQSALTDRIDHIDADGYVHWKVKK
jgi:hypothetical protein